MESRRGRCQPTTRVSSRAILTQLIQRQAPGFGCGWLTLHAADRERLLIRLDRGRRWDAVVVVELLAAEPQEPVRGLLDLRPDSSLNPCVPTALVKRSQAVAHQRHERRADGFHSIRRNPDAQSLRRHQHTTARPSSEEFVKEPDGCGGWRLGYRVGEQRPEPQEEVLDGHSLHDPVHVGGVFVGDPIGVARLQALVKLVELRHHEGGRPGDPDREAPGLRDLKPDDVHEVGIDDRAFETQSLARAAIRS